MRKKLFGITLLMLIFMAFYCPGGDLVAKAPDTVTTFCNPINLDYRFVSELPNRREAADPTVVLYKGDYYLFASQGKGYWYSNNFKDWTHVTPNAIYPIIGYAPTALVMGDKMYMTAFSTMIFETDDPKSGIWKLVKGARGLYDPCLFKDDDGRVYQYHGCDRNGPIYVTELDPKTMKAITRQKVLFTGNAQKHGWQRCGDNNEKDPSEIQGFLEGSWMTKHNGIYYLHFGTPGTEYKIYADGLYTSTSPTGPFTPAVNNPLSFKPLGFITGAGHGSSFKDKKGNQWIISTSVICVAHVFERRLNLYPAGFDRDGIFYTNTVFGDYPHYLPDQKKNAAQKSFTGWMLLSYRKKASASSVYGTKTPQNAFDEEIKTWWSAETGDPGEWISVDLGKTCRINAVQINFAEQDIDPQKLAGAEDYHQYLLEYSNDNEKWEILVDKSKNTLSVPHDYIQLAKPVKARYLRLTNVHFPANLRFSVRDLRVFGSGLGKRPAPVKGFSAVRNPEYDMSALLKWERAENADGYIVRFGKSKDKLYLHYQVWQDNTLTVNSLDAGAKYYFAIDSYNDSGVTRGKTVYELD